MTDSEMQQRKLIAVRLRIAARDLDAAATAMELQSDDVVAERMANASTQLRLTCEEYEQVTVTQPMGRA